MCGLGLGPLVRSR